MRRRRRRPFSQNTSLLNGSCRCPFSLVLSLTFLSLSHLRPFSFSLYIPLSIQLSLSQAKKVWGRGYWSEVLFVIAHSRATVLPAEKVNALEVLSLTHSLSLFLIEYSPLGTHTHTLTHIYILQGIFSKYVGYLSTRKWQSRDVLEVLPFSLFLPLSHTRTQREGEGDIIIISSSV